VSRGDSGREPVSPHAVEKSPRLDRIGTAQTGLWKCRRRGRAQNARPPRLGNLAQTREISTFPQAHRILCIKKAKGPTVASLRSTPCWASDVSDDVVNQMLLE